MQNIYRKIVGCGLLLLLSGACATAQQSQENIRLNQVGFYPNAPKLAVIVGDARAGKFYIKTPDLSRTLFTGSLSEVKRAEFSQKPTRIADFSGFAKPGAYVLDIPDLGHSYTFDIQPEVHQAVAAAALKGFYFQRASADLPEQYAGKWHRSAGHPDNKVLVHPSAASDARPAGTIIAAPRGWYDAGDYNKYIVNSGISMGTLLSAYEDFPQFYKAQQLNIPESGNALPDLLDEVLWNLRWMLAMQDPYDGGVYHKLTNADFDGMVMPAEATKARYVVQKGTAATLDFAAVMAQASRVYRRYSEELPGLADSCLAASVRAWEWAQKNPRVAYDQTALNKQFKPAISTGAYGDDDFSDEFAWAAAELYATTKKESYYKAVNMLADPTMPLPAWPQVRLLGYYTLLRHSGNLTKAAQQDLPVLKGRLLQLADSLVQGASTHAYRTVMGSSANDYSWGSSSVAANQGIALVQAYQLSSDKRYLEAALANLDYLLGRNAVGYSFVTGYGDKATKHPHHRPSVADGVADPVPGLLAGGTNAHASQQDHCAGYNSAAAPDEVYLDTDCSYASNEIAINWNAPLVYLAGALEALQQRAGFTGGTK